MDDKAILSETAPAIVDADIPKVQPDASVPQHTQDVPQTEQSDEKDHEQTQKEDQNHENDEPGNDNDDELLEDIQDGTQQDLSQTNKDYGKVFEKYQERFSKVYSTSQDLFQAELSQRQALNFYCRRNNALLDLLHESENNEPAPLQRQILSENDKLRIDNLMKLNPKLQKTLSPLLEIENRSQQLKSTYKINLLINETIPELINDDIDNLELNPQDIEPWVRRHYPHLVISKYMPINVSANKFNESNDIIPTSVSKRKRKILKDEDYEDDPQAKRLKK